MAKHRTRTSKQRKQLAADAAAADSSGTRAAIVLWMLTLFTALLCELGYLAGTWLMAAEPEEKAWELFADLMSISSQVFGLACLVLLGLVTYLRKALPPYPLAILAVLVGVIPLVLSYLRVTSPAAS